MQEYSLQPGDTVYARQAIINDGSVPGLEQNALLAVAGTRGVVIDIGHFEVQPRLKVLQVRFENADGSLGPGVGCWPYEVEWREPR